MANKPPNYGRLFLYVTAGALLLLLASPIIFIYAACYLFDSCL